jgi:tRNA 2-thiocytidine biosynthesis protein TtcA
MRDKRVPNKPVHRKGRSSLKRGKQHFPYQVQQVFRWMGKAIDQFQMIAQEDRIAVGVSGVDSLCLLWLLRERLKWIPVAYQVKAVYVDLGFGGTMGSTIEEYLQREGFDYEIIKTDFGIRAHGPANRENPCFLCSQERRKTLFSFVHDNNCNKLALGHHLEDINATFFLNVLYGGSLSTMLPCQELFEGRVTIIRPLALIYKEQLERLADFLVLPPIANPCPSSENSERKEVNDLLNHFYKKDRRIRYNIFQAMRNINSAYLPK